MYFFVRGDDWGLVVIFTEKTITNLFNELTYISKGEDILRAYLFLHKSHFTCPFICPFVLNIKYPDSVCISCYTFSLFKVFSNPNKAHTLLLWLACLLSHFFLAGEGLPRGMWDGIEPLPSALGAWSLSHWTAREVLLTSPPLLCFSCHEKENIRL